MPSYSMQKLRTKTKAQIIEVLSLAKTDLSEAVDSSNQSLPYLHSAAQIGSVTVVEALLDYGAMIDQTEPWLKATALHVASQHGNEAVVKLLLSKGAEPQAKDSSGNTALHLAACYGGRRTIDALVGRAPTLLMATNKNGETPIHIALALPHKSEVDDAAVYLLDQYKEFPSCLIHLAILNSYEKTIKILLKQPLDKLMKMLLEQDEDGNTALHIAASLDNDSSAATLKTLVESFFDQAMRPEFINKQNKKGDTALHLLISKKEKNVGLIRYLCAKNAKTDIPNLKGETAKSLFLLNPFEGGHSLFTGPSTTTKPGKLELPSRRSGSIIERPTSAPVPASPRLTPRRMSLSSDQPPSHPITPPLAESAPSASQGPAAPPSGELAPGTGVAASSVGPAAETGSGNREETPPLPPPAAAASQSAPPARGATPPAQDSKLSQPAPEFSAGYKIKTFLQNHWEKIFLVIIFLIAAYLVACTFLPFLTFGIPFVAKTGGLLVAMGLPASSSAMLPVTALVLAGAGILAGLTMLGSVLGIKKGVTAWSEKREGKGGYMPLESTDIEKPKPGVDPSSDNQQQAAKTPATGQTTPRSSLAFNFNLLSQLRNLVCRPTAPFPAVGPAASSDLAPPSSSNSAAPPR
jgi:ankyrin repeat protein